MSMLLLLLFWWFWWQWLWWSWKYWWFTAPDIFWKISASGFSVSTFSSTGRPALVLYPGENKRPRTNSIQQIVKTTVSFFSPSPDEPIPERIIGLTDAEREEGAFRVDPAGAHTHWIPTHLRRVWDEIYSTLGVSTCLVEHHSNPINFILVDLHRPANMDGFKLKAWR